MSSAVSPLAGCGTRRELHCRTAREARRRRNARPSRGPRRDRGSPASRSSWSAKRAGSERRAEERVPLGPTDRRDGPGRGTSLTRSGRTRRGARATVADWIDRGRQLGRDRRFRHRGGPPRASTRVTTSGTSSAGGSRLERFRLSVPDREREGPSPAGVLRQSPRAETAARARGCASCTGGPRDGPGEDAALRGRRAHADALW
jgi:hypothetical protein